MIFHAMLYALCPMLFFSRERHLASVIAEQTDDWSEKDHENKIEGVRHGRVRPSPEDQDNFKNEKKDRELNLSLHKKSEF